MAKRIFCIVLALVLALPLFALAQDKPEMDLPVYPGGEPSLEIDLSNEDILPMLQAMLPMMSGRLGKIADKIQPEEIAEILKGVKRIEVLQLNVDKPGVTDEQITSFYHTNLPAGKCTRIFWQSTEKMGTMAVYTQGAGEGIYAYRVRTVVDDGKPIKRIEVAKIDGKVDFAKLLEIASRFIKLG